MPIIGISSSGGMRPTTPTIGTATDGGTGTTASVAFTPSTYIGKGTITYTATSSPGNITGTGSSSPITVSGLTTGTAYTFTVTGTTNYGVSSAASASSNSVTPSVPGAYDSIASASPSGTATVTFSNIPQTYKHLQVRLNAQVNNSTTGIWQLGMRINNISTGSLYYFGTLQATGTGTNVTANYGDSNSIFLDAAYGTGQNYNGLHGVGIVDFIDYTNTNKYKTTTVVCGANNNSANNNNIIDLLGFQIQTFNAITQIEVFTGGASFLSGSSIALYGIGA
jgi:hypothetical protein